MKTWAEKLIALSFGIVFTTAAGAQTYPTKPITIVVATNPGGTTDMLGRLIGKRLSEAWGQTVIIENKPGANNQIGIEFASRATPDGYTLLVALDSFVTGPILANKRPHDETLLPITGLVRASHALFAHPSVPFNTFRDLIDLAKKKPGELNFGTPGMGSGAHLSMEHLQMLAGVKFTAVHYRGAAPALADVLSGHIQLMFMDLGNVLAQVKEQRVKLLGVGARERLPQYPNLPVLGETQPGFSAGAWWGLFTPRGTPDEIVAKINAEVHKAFSDPAVRAQFIEPQNLELFTGTPAALAEFVKAERVQWETVIRSANLSTRSNPN